MKKKLINIINKLPYVRGLYSKKLLFEKNSCFPPGHFYSTIVDVKDIKKRQDEIWFNESIDRINGIDLKTQEQLELVKSFESYYNEIPFGYKKKDNLRYYFENGFYSFTDAIFLYSMIRNLTPKKIIEVGSGFSSSVMLDTNELFFNNEINLTFIEPYTDRLKSLLKESDYNSTSIIESEVQKVPLSVFEELNGGDILFIDSTHVVKTGSDVNHILFNILPRLKSGVLIHFHDVFYPFEYPKEWVFNGHNWNEDYFLKAFLMYNSDFKIRLFSHYLHTHHDSIFKDMPICYKNFGGNLWIEKK